MPLLRCDQLRYRIKIGSDELSVDLSKTTVSLLAHSIDIRNGYISISHFNYVLKALVSIVDILIILIQGLGYYKNMI